MKTRNHIISTVFAAAALLAFSSCEHKELCYNHAHVVNLHVVFDWAKAPDASPESMSLYLFPEDGSEPMRYEFVGRDGGTIRVPIGAYDAIGLNSDTEGVYYRNTERFGTFEATTQPTDLLSAGLNGLVSRTENAPRAEGSEEERIALPADRLWSASATGLKLDMAAIDTLVLSLDTSFCRYRVEIVNGENLKYVSGLSAALTGMAGGFLPADGRLSDERVTVPFGMSVTVPEEGDDAGREVVVGETLVFGHCPGGSGTHNLVVYAILADGSKYAYTFDADEVTRQIHAAPDPRNVLIRLDGLPLPKPITNGGGFHPEINEWDEIEIGLEM